MATAHIGVLIVPPIQLLDLAPIDLFAMTTQSYFSAAGLPALAIAQALPSDALKITYISASGPNSQAGTTAHLNVHIDAGLDDASVAPGNLDILLIPGPPPGMKPEEEVLAFVRGHVESGVDLITICSGVFVAGYAGVLEGKRATGTRGCWELLEREFPGTEWVDKRFVRDGRVWSSGGITNGMDLVGVYMREKWLGLAETVLAMADVDVRSEEYSGPRPAGL